MKPCLPLLALLALAALFSAVEPAGAQGASDERVGTASAKIRFAEGGHARIPFDLRGTHAWVRGTLNGSDSLWMVIDTGASSSVMDDDVARSLGLRVVGEHRSRGAGGAQTGSTYADVTIGLPGVTIERKRLGGLALASLSRASGRPMQAIVGQELFAECIVRFDYAAGVLDIWEAKKPPANLGGIALPLTFVENLPYVEGTIEVAGRAPLRGRFVIDSGSSQALMLAREVAERDSLTAAMPRTLEVMGRGVGGETRQRMGRAEAFSLGELRFERPTVTLGAEGPGRITARGTIGNIGGQILNRCRVTFDYSRKRVRFEPGPNFDKPFEADMSGAVLTRADSTFDVRVVNPDSPAAEAGLQVGDRVTRIDGAPAVTLAPATLRSRMQEEGRSVQIEWLRGDQPMNATLKLRRLI